MPSDITPEDIAGALPDDDELGTTIIDVYENDHKLFWRLHRIFNEIKQPNMWAQTLDVRPAGYAEVIVVYKSDRELTTEELLHEWRIWRSERYGG